VDFVSCPWSDNVKECPARLEEVSDSAIDASPSVPTLEPYTVDHAIDGLFIEKERFTSILDLWNRKRNIILSGPPGVGKTYFAKRLAYALLKEKAPDRVAAIQFHPSYAYEDFIQGYRPTSEGLKRQNGIFYQFCERARDDQERQYVFVI
jgi:5-methylcytosine-specific restriction protein B